MPDGSFDSITTNLNTMPISQEIALLIKKYISGEISSEESKRLSRWLEQSPDRLDFFERCLEKEKLSADLRLWDELADPENQAWLQETKSRTFQAIRSTPSPDSKSKRRYWVGAVAAILVCVALGAIMQRGSRIGELQVTTSTWYAPKNDAELMLSDGRKINLRSSQQELIFNDHLQYADGTPIADLAQEKLETLQATIVVPAGGQYKIQLSDGTEVWLNAMSRLVYPLKFKEESREVYLEGEGYFDVASVNKADQRVPFLVHTEEQTVRVTGTQFNLSAYRDNPGVTTTLIEGSVQVDSKFGTVSLSPNQQSELGRSGIHKKEVNIAPYVAWKDNKFVFFETELREVMRMLSRWYDIEVSYQQGVTEDYFYGQIAKDKDLGTVLRILEKSGLQFELQPYQNTYKLHVIKSSNNTIADMHNDPT